MSTKHKRGRALTAYRKKHGLSKAALCALFGQGRSGQVSKFETGERPLTLELAADVAIRLEVDFEALLSKSQRTLVQKIVLARGLVCQAA